MQLLFTREEAVLLAALLEEHERQLRDPLATGGNQESTIRRRKHARVESLLDTMSSTHPEFDADQLDDLAEALRDCKERIVVKLASATDVSSKSSLEQRLKRLEQILDKVTEACAMA